MDLADLLIVVLLVAMVVAAIAFAVIGGLHITKRPRKAPFP